MTFHYEAYLRVNFAQRDAYLQKHGKEPGAEEKLLSFIKGSYHLADMTDVVTWEPGSYNIKSITTLTTPLNYAFDGQTLARYAWGERSPAGLSTLAYEEVRGHNPAFLSRVDAPAHVVRFYRGGKFINGVEIGAPSTDILSLPYVDLGRATATSVPVAMSDGRTMKRFTLVRGEAWNFKLDGRSIPAHRFYKTASNGDDSTFEVWLSDRSNIPLRYLIGLNARYGATLQANLTDASIPIN